MTKVLKYLKKYWYFALLTPLFMVLEVSMDLVQPSLMSRIVDEGIVAGDIQLILNLGGQMLIFTVIGCLGGVLSGVVEPIGAVLTILTAQLVVPALPYLLSFAAGAMLYVVVEELIPEMSQGDHSNIGTVFFAVGFSIMMMLDVALG